MKETISHRMFWQNHGRQNHEERHAMKAIYSKPIIKRSLLAPREDRPNEPNIPTLGN